MKMNTTFLTFALLAGSLQASTIDLVTGWGVHDGFGLGAGAVALSVDGTDVKAYDYTLLLSAYVGETWTADLTSLPTLPNYYSSDPNAAFKDAEVTWAATGLAGASTPAAIIAWQYALYDIFDPTAPFNAASIADSVTVHTEALGGFAPGWTFIDSPPDSKEYVQGFVTYAPEPATMALMGIGLLAIGMLRRKA
jgi:hypothetical protein